MNKPPAFQFYVKDWLSSERVSLMTGCAEGLYIRLLAVCWDNGSLPADEAALQALAPKHKACWKSCWTEVRRHFRKRGRRLYNVKLDQQRRELQQRAKQAKEAALTRWRSNATAHADASKEHMPDACEPASLEQCTASASASAITPTTTGYPPEFERTWAVYPKRSGGNPKKSAFKAWRARLNNGATAEEIHAGVERYARFCEAVGKVGTEYVKHAATFFGPDEHFREPWDAPASADDGKPRGLRDSYMTSEDLRRLDEEMAP